MDGICSHSKAQADQPKQTEQLALALSLKRAKVEVLLVKK
jgi:hypothetical protein